MFLQHGIIVTATVTGHQRYLSDLAQGRLEIPCNLRSLGEEKFIMKLKKVLKLKMLKPC